MLFGVADAKPVADDHKAALGGVLARSVRQHSGIARATDKVYLSDPRSSTIGWVDFVPGARSRKTRLAGRFRGAVSSYTG
jgi:hypothetical protein